MAKSDRKNIFFRSVWISDALCRKNEKNEGKPHQNLEF